MIRKELLRLAIPNILSNISVPLLSSVDVALMGQLSIVHLGAIGLASMIFNFFFWSFGFLRMGTTGLVAQSEGAEDEARARQVLSRSLLIALVLAFVILIFKEPIYAFSRNLLSISSEHNALVYQYFSLRIVAAPATLTTYCLIGWLFGKKDTISPLQATLLINLLNIGISYYLVAHLGWGITGAAVGTVLAEYVGLGFLILIVRRRYRVKTLPKPEIAGASGFFKINFDLFARTLALTASFALFYRFSAQEGAIILGTNVLLLQFLSWLSYSVDGFAHAAEILVGDAVGRKDAKNLYKVVWATFELASYIAIIYSLVFFMFTLDLASLFTEDSKVLDTILGYRTWLLVLPLITIWCYIWDGIYIGLTRTHAMRDTMIISLFIYICVSIALEGNVTNHIWYSFVIMLFLRGLLLTIHWYRYEHRRLLYILK